MIGSDGDSLFVITSCYTTSVLINLFIPGYDSISVCTHLSVPSMIAW